MGQVNDVSRVSEQKIDPYYDRYDRYDRYQVVPSHFETKWDDRQASHFPAQHSASYSPARKVRTEISAAGVR